MDRQIHLYKKKAGICSPVHSLFVFLSFRSVQKAHVNWICMAPEKAAAAGCDLGEKVFAFVADCSNVNIGDANGAIAKMGDTWSPCVLIMKDLAHGVELSMKDGLKYGNPYDKVIPMLSYMYAFYYKSHLQRTELQGSFYIFPDAGLVMALRRHVTIINHQSKASNLTCIIKFRLIEISVHIERIVCMWLGTFCHCFQVIRNMKAMCILKMMNSWAVLDYAYFPRALLIPLARLSKKPEDAKVYTCYWRPKLTTANKEEWKIRISIRLVKYTWMSNHSWWTRYSGVFAQPIIRQLV